MSGRDLSLGCFGKLPFWPEFLEVGVAQPGSRELRRFIRAGRELAVDAAHEDGDAGVDPLLAAGAHRRILLHSRRGDALAALLRPSRDAGGRPFPFAVFVHVPSGPWKKAWSLLPLALRPVWDALDDAWHDLAAVSTETTFRERLDAVRIPEPEPASRVLGEFHRMGADSAAALLERVGVAGVTDAARRLNAAFRDDDAALVRLPVSRDAETACFEAGFWIELAGRRLFRRPTPSVFLEGDAGPHGRHVALRFGAPLAEDYGAVLAPAGAEPAAAPTPAGDAEPTTYATLLSRRHALR